MASKKLSFISRNETPLTSGKRVAVIGIGINVCQSFYFCYDAICDNKSFFALTQISAQIIPNILKLENIYVTQFLRTDSQSYLPSVRTFFYEKLGHYMLTQFLSEKTNYQRWMEIVIRSHEPFQALSNLHVSLA